MTNDERARILGQLLQAAAAVTEECLRDYQSDATPALAALIASGEAMPRLTIDISESPLVALFLSFADGRPPVHLSTIEAPARQSGSTDLPA